MLLDVLLQSFWEMHAFLKGIASIGKCSILQRNMLWFRGAKFQYQNTAYVCSLNLIFQQNSQEKRGTTYKISWHFLTEFHIQKTLYLKITPIDARFFSDFVEILYLNPNPASIQEFHETSVVGKLICLISFQVFEGLMSIQFCFNIVLVLFIWTICGNPIIYILENIGRFWDLLTVSFHMHDTLRSVQNLCAWLHLRNTNTSHPQGQSKNQCNEQKKGPNLY